MVFVDVKCDGISSVLYVYVLYMYVRMCLLVFERNGGKVALVSCSCDSNSINLVLGMYLYLFLTVCTLFFIIRNQFIRN